MPYDPTNLDVTTATGRINVARLYVGDTDTSEEQLTDDEYTFYLSVSNNKPLQCAVLVAYALGAKYARLVDTELEGVLKEDYSRLSENYYKLSSTLKMQSAQSNLGIGLPPNVGLDSSDPTTPEFTVGQFEYPTNILRGYNEV